MENLFGGTETQVEMSPSEIYLTISRLHKISFILLWLTPVELDRQEKSSRSGRVKEHLIRPHSRNARNT